MRSDGCSAISIMPTAACDVGEHTNTSSGGTAAAAPGANESAIIAPRQSAKSSTPVASTGPLTRRRCVHAVRPISPSAFSISSGVAPSGRMMSTPVNMFFVLAPEPESRRERPSTELNDARLGREHDDPALTAARAHVRRRHDRQAADLDAAAPADRRLRFLALEGVPGL